MTTGDSHNGSDSQCRLSDQVSANTYQHPLRAASAGHFPWAWPSPRMLSSTSYFIQRYRFLTIVQLGLAAELKPSFSAELLRSLKARDFLGYFGNVGMQGHGKTPKVYYLTRKGYELLIIDELGYVPLSTTGTELLFEV